MILHHLGFMCWMGLALVFMCLPAQAAFITSYHVGNSLTGDARVGAFIYWAGQRGESWRVGSHILGGSSLKQINAQQNSSAVRAVKNPGPIPEAFPDNRFGFLTLQTHPEPSGPFTSHLSDDLEAIRSLTDQAKANGMNDGMQLFIYSPWARSSDYKAGAWTDPVAGNDPLTEHSRAYSKRVFEGVRSGENPDELPVRVVPTGEVIFEIYNRILSHELDYFDSFEAFYRDDVHMSVDLGRFVATTTMFAALSGESPVGLEIPKGYFIGNVDGNGDPTAVIHQNPDAVLELQSLVWDVVSTHPHALVPEPGSLSCFVGCTLLLIRRRRLHRVVGTETF